MWFLDAGIALRLLLGCALWTAAAALAGRRGLQARLNRFLVFPDLLLIALVSWQLAAFYAVYTLYTWGLCRLAGRAKRARTAVFVLACALCAAPFLYVRVRELFAALPLAFALTGIAYNALKAVDGVYYAHYTGEDLPLPVYANFLLFFPVLTAGPIFRYRDFAAELDAPAPITGERLTRCARRLILGYFKKVVVLALAQQLLNRLAALSPRLGVSLLACLLSYALLWLDMSGYADIAVAMGSAMGLEVPENFKHPLRAASFTQFWRNWHVSLTDWIREHIFVVLNGKKLNRYQGALIGFVTMLVMGLWHGFSLTFLCDGLVNGTLLAAENLFGLTTVNRRRVGRGYYLFRCCLTNLIFAFTTIFYTLDSAQLAAVLRGFVRL